MAGRKSNWQAEYLHDEELAFKHVESLLWADGPVCPKCGTINNAVRLKVSPTKRVMKSKGEVVLDENGQPRMKEYPARHGLWKCKEAQCRAQFTVRMGTIFEESRLPMTKWLQAIYLMCASKKGVSSHQLSRVLEVDYKSAWFLSHRIREAMKAGGGRLFGGPGQIVQIDETYFGEVDNPSKVRADGQPYIADRPNPGARGKGGKGSANKRAIVSLVEPGGNSRTFHVEKANRETVEKILRENVDPASRLHTDESYLYRRIGREHAAHEMVKHSAKEYVRDDVTTNHVEGYFSVFKRGMKGVYQFCSEKHLHRYVAEFDFRFNHRAALGVDDQARTIAAILGAKGKRLTYGTVGGR